MSKSVPQTEIILRLLRNHPDGITPLDALRWAGCLRLAARISDLRRDGHRIQTDIVKTPSGARVARYRLVAA